MIMKKRTTPPLIVITPTQDRPEGINMLAKWIAHQDLKPDQWIIVDSSKDKPVYSFLGTLSCDVLIVPGQRGLEKIKSQASNMLAAVDMVWERDLDSHSTIAILEDDDYYSKDHLSTLVWKLSGKHIAGSGFQVYYNIRQMKWRVFRNKGSSFAQTGLRPAALPIVKKACETALEHDRPKGLDRAVWDTIEDDLKNEYESRKVTCVGMKGLPGEPNIGIGGRAANFWDDPHGVALEFLMGWSAADIYKRKRERWYGR